MKAYLKSDFFFMSLLITFFIPILIWKTGNIPARSLLKESLSIITILAFYQMMGQFFWARTNRYAVKDLKMKKIINYHKIIGYTFVAIIIFHPALLVIPRFFEAGVDPLDAFITIITTFNQGIILGIIAWCMMLVLGITSLARKKLPMKYKTWRVFHGILAILFIFTASWHVIDLGRHSNLAMSFFIILLVTGGVLPMGKEHVSKIMKQKGKLL